MNAAQRFQLYLKQLKQPFIKLCRMRFLYPDGTTAFALDNNPYNRRSGAFIQSGQLTVNLQNGQRRSASVKLSNLDGAYDYNVNRVWFGQQIALDEGLVLPDGSEFYLPQGVFYVSDPTETFKPGEKTADYNLVTSGRIWTVRFSGTLKARMKCPSARMFFRRSGRFCFCRGETAIPWTARSRFLRHTTTDARRGCRTAQRP